MAELFTLAQRRNIVLPLYRKTLKACFAFGKIDPFASFVIRAIVTKSFREHSAEGTVARISDQVAEGQRVLDTIQRACRHEPVPVRGLLRLAYGKEGELKPIFVKAHQQFAVKASERRKAPGRLFGKQAVRSIVP